MMNKNLGDLSSRELELEKKEECKRVVIIFSTLVVIIPMDSYHPQISMVDLGCADPAYGNFIDDMKSFCATTSDGPRVFLFGGNMGEPRCTNMYSYDLLDLNKHQYLRCNPTPFEQVRPLIVPVGDSVYFLSVCSDDGLLTFCKYHPESDLWDILPSRFINEGVKYPSWMVYCYLDSASHVVIGNTLHISLFNSTGEVSSFAFDTQKQAWEVSNLFHTYWSEQTDNNLSPSIFYGGPVWSAYYHSECFGSRITPNSRPFGFNGKGIMWGKNVLLGRHCFSNDYQLVAFQLNEKGSVFASQPFAITNLIPLSNHSRLVDIDLDKNGVFGLVHFDYPLDQVQLLKYKIQIESDADNTFSLKKIGTEVVPDATEYACNVFLV